MSESEHQRAGRPPGGLLDRGPGRRGVDSAPTGYAVISELGRGRLGRVLLCREDANDRQVVVKVLDVRPVDDRARLVLESELQAAAAASRHGFAVPIEAVWPDQQVGFCLRQRYCPGGTAQAALDTSGPLRPDDVVVLGIRAAAALSHAHRSGILHLDVRPENLFRDAAGQWSLADAGLTRAAGRANPAQGVLFDSRYASRELFGWEEPGPACDVYALGATMYTLLVGEPASAEAARQGDAALYTNVLADGAPPPNSNLSPGLASLIRRMTAPDPASRPPLTEVDRLLRGLVSPAVAAHVPAVDDPAARVAVPLPTPAMGTAAPKVDVAEEQRRQRLRLGVIGGVVAALFIASAVAVTATSGDDDGELITVRPDALTGVTLPQVPAEAASLLSAKLPNAYFPPKSNTVQIRWGAPDKTDELSGYLVLALSTTGDVLARQYAVPGELSAYFTSPPVGPKACFAVLTLVDNGSEVQVAPATPFCPNGGEVVAPAAAGTDVALGGNPPVAN